MLDDYLFFKSDIFRLHMCGKQGIHRIAHLLYVECILIQYGLSAFNFGHFKHIVDDGQKDLTGITDFSNIFFALCSIVLLFI